MRTTPHTSRSFRFPIRQVLLGIVAVGFAMVGLALLAEAMASDGGTVYLAKFTSGSSNPTVGPSLEATGYGRASAPAERATVQLLVIRDLPYGSDGTASSSSASATPAARDRSTLSPIIDALESAGVSEEAVSIVTSPSLISVCNNYSRCSSARIDVTVEKPTIEQLNAIVDAAGKAAISGGMVLHDVGVGYSIADCRALTRQARELAVADAKARAEDQAQILGVTLGRLIVSSEPGPERPRDATGCEVYNATFGDSWWTPGSVGLTVPAFDPNAPAEASVSVEVTLVYAIAEPTSKESA